ncbi:unnamed protein product [Fraxinus pennsylvanica]|uniref:Hcy-binding domain-containing protein n=1 Tax=Fraxinus pennsylvanica TaxID=56036 RepID=A0AAD1ZW77_9LAMI|nr:unnamed protein product [Fraxinus pennsylvanica]
MGPPSLLSDLPCESGPVAVIESGLATELERHVFASIKDQPKSCALGSTMTLPSLAFVYLEAGADITITASYQATIQGIQAKDFSQEESEDLLRRSVTNVCEARPHGMYTTVDVENPLLII